MTWNRYEPPLELRAAVHQWQQQSGALSALPGAPVQPTERPGPLARAVEAVRRATRAVLTRRQPAGRRPARPAAVRCTGARAGTRSDPW